MSRTWITSDNHFGHARIYSFVDDAGNRVRPWASSLEEGDALMIEKWNAVIRPQDRVYHLGDVAIPRKSLQVVSRLNGRKILIRGNHDIFKLRDYAEHFDDIRGSHRLDRFILSHYPLHANSIPRWCAANIHGHTHGNLVLDADGAPDPRFVNACVEKTGGAPVNFEQIRDAFPAEHRCRKTMRGMMNRIVTARDHDDANPTVSVATPTDALVASKRIASIE